MKGFPLVPNLMTMAVSLHYFTEFGNLGDSYVTVFEVCPIMSATKMEANPVLEIHDLLWLFPEITEKKMR